MVEEFITILHTVGKAAATVAIAGQHAAARNSCRMPCPIQIVCCFGRRLVETTQHFCGKGWGSRERCSMFVSTSPHRPGSKCPECSRPLPRLGALVMVLCAVQCDVLSQFRIQGQVHGDVAGSCLHTVSDNHPAFRGLLGASVSLRTSLMTYACVCRNRGHFCSNQLGQEVGKAHGESGNERL